MLRRIQLLKLYHFFKPKTFYPSPSLSLTLRPEWNFSSNQDPFKNSQTNSSSSFSKPPPTSSSTKPLEDSVSLFEEDATKSISDYQKMLDSLRSSQNTSSLTKEQNLTILRLLYKLGTANAVKQDKASEALKFYNDALSLAEKFQATDSIEIGHIYNGIGRIYLQDEKLEEAANAFAKASNVFSKFQSDNRLQPQVIQNLCSTAVVYEKKKEYDKALESYGLALQKVKDTSAEDAALASVAIYDGIGYLYLLKMEYEQAIDSWKKGLYVAAAQYGKGSVEAKDFYENLAKAYIEQEQYPEALEYAEHSYNADIEFYTPDSIGLIGGLYLLGKVHTLMGDNDKAIERYEKVLEILSKDEISRPDQVGYTHLLIAKSYLKSSHLDEANESFNKGRERVIKAFGDQSLELAEYTVSWGKALKKNAGTMDKAKLAYQDGLDIFKKVKSVNDESQRKIRDAFAALGEILFYEDNLDQSLKFFEEFLQLSEATKDNKRKTVCEVYSWIGSIYLQKEDYHKSVENYEKALNLCSELDPNDLDREYHYRNLGLAYEKKGNLEKAQQTYQKALEFLHRTYGSNDEVTRRSKTLLIEVLNKMNKHDEAEKVRQEYKEHSV